MTHNSEAPDQSPRPDAQVGHHNSTIKVYNIAQFTDADPNEMVRVYTADDLPGEMQRASLVTQTGETQEGDATLNMTFTLHLDNMTTGSTVLAKLQNHLLVDTQNYYQVERTQYSNVVNIRARGLRLLARFDNEPGQLTISNSMSLGVEGMKELRVSPTPLNHGSMDARTQVLEMGRIMADILTYEPSDPSAYRGWPEAKKGCLIEIGKDIRELPSPSRRATLGKSATAGASGSEQISRAETTTFEESDSEVRLSDIGGHKEIKRTFANIALLRKHPEIAAKHKLRVPRSVLLYGEPGTGKSMLANALAAELGAVVRRIQGDEIYGKYVGDSERNIQRIFDELNTTQVPTLALWDEFDASMSIPDRVDSGADQIRNAVAGIFKQQMELLGPNVFIAMITNDLDKVPLALRRDGRIDYQLHVQMPDQAARLDIMWTILSKHLTVDVTDINGPGDNMEPVLSSPLFDNSIDWDAVAHRADGMSGAGIDGVFRRLIEERTLEEIRTGHVTPSTQADFTRTIAAMQRDSPS
jgi:ATP-dependent 26S proteasome regulatory subunit